MMREIWWILVGTFPVYKIPCWANISHPKPKPTAKRCGLNSLSEINLHQKKKKNWDFDPFVYYSLLVVVVPKKGKEQPALAITSDRWGSERHHPSNEKLGDAATRR